MINHFSRVKSEQERDVLYKTTSTFIHQQNRKTLEKTFAGIKAKIIELTMYPNKIDKSNKSLRSEKASVLNQYRNLSNLYSFSNSLDTLIK